MKKTLIKFLAIVSILTIIPLAVFAGIICEGHIFKYQSESITGYNKNYSKTHHYVNVRAIYECSVDGCHKKDVRKTGYPEKHDYSKKDKMTEYSENVTNASVHIKEIFETKVCKCGDRKIVKRIYINEYEKHNYSKKVKVGVDKYGDPKYRYYCVCGDPKPEK